MLIHIKPTPEAQTSTLQLMGDCQNYGPFLGPYYNTGPNRGPNLGDPKRDHNFDNPPYALRQGRLVWTDPDNEQRRVAGLKMEHC